MSTTINKTDGTVLTVVADGAVDVSTTELAFIGRLYRNYGELVNENFVKLLENFARNTAPAAPVVGQLWYDSAVRQLKVFRNTGFVSLAANTISSAEPNAPSLGDLWYDTVDEQLKTWTGSFWQVLAPQYSAAQGKSGVFVENILDTVLNNHIAVLVYQQNSVISVFSRDEEYIPQAAISGFASIKKGITLSGLAGYRYHGVTTDSELLNGISSSSFLRSDQNDSTIGTLSIVNNAPLILGTDGSFRIDISGGNAVLRKITSGSIQFYVDNNELAAEINDDQQLVLRTGSSISPSLVFEGDSNTGILHVSPNVLGFAANGNTRLTVSNSGANVIGTLTASTISATTVSGTNGSIPTLAVNTQLTAPTINGNTNFLNNVTVTGSLFANGAVTIGDDLSDAFTINSNTINIPNGVQFENGDVGIDGILEVSDASLFLDDLAVVGDQFVLNDSFIGDDCFISDELLVQYDLESGFASLRVTGDRHVLINANGPKVASSQPGDLTLGDFNTVYAANTAKYWAVWQDDDDTSGSLSASGIGVVGNATQNNGTSVSMPAGLQQNDVIFCAEASDSGPKAVPSGFIEITSGTNNSITYSISYSIMGSTPISSATGLSVDSRYVFTAVRGVNTSNILNTISAVASAASGMPNPPALTTTSDATLVFAVGFLDKDAATTVLPPEGFTLSGATGRSVVTNGSVVGSSTMVAYRRFNEPVTVNPGAFTAATGNNANLGITYSVNLNIPSGSGFQYLNGYHVDSITRLSTGLYRINLEYSMTDSSFYAVVATGSATDMNVVTFPVGGDYIDVEARNLSGARTNINTYMSVVVYGI